MATSHSASPPAQEEDVHSCLAVTGCRATSLGHEHLARLGAVRLTDETAFPTQPPRGCSQAGSLLNVSRAGIPATSDRSDWGTDPVTHSDLITVTSHVPSSPHLVGPSVH